jgi:hypothetical protein
MNGRFDSMAFQNLKGGGKMVEAKMPHPEHEKHLCYLQNLGYVEKNLADYKTLVKNPKFVCKNCGRAAGSEKNLCNPDKL